MSGKYLRDEADLINKLLDVAHKGGTITLEKRDAIPLENILEQLKNLQFKDSGYDW